MSRAGLIAAPLVLLAAALVPGASGQSPRPPCAPGAPTPTFTVNGKAVPVYTTHDLLVRVKLPGDPNFFVVSFDVSGVRVLPRESEGDEGVARAVGDAPGTLTANATLETTDSQGNPCTVSGSATFEVRPAETPTVSKLRRPPVYKPDPKLSWDTEFAFRVTPGPTGDRRPITVDARAVQRARVPGPGVKKGSRTFAMRVSDAGDDDLDRRALGSCGTTTIICPKKVQTWPRGAEVNVDGLGRGGAAAAIKVDVTLPRGYPLGPLGSRGRGRTPAGVDVQVLQGGSLIARLRIAADCIDSGQYSRCKYKKLTTKLR